MSRSLVQETTGGKTQVSWQQSQLSSIYVLVASLKLVPELCGGVFFLECESMNVTRPKRSVTMQLAGLASALVVLVTILKLGPLFQELPKVQFLAGHRRLSLEHVGEKL